MKEPAPDARSHARLAARLATRFAAAHAIAKELKVDPEHPGTLRLAAALGDTLPTEPTTELPAESGAPGGAASGRDVSRETACRDDIDTPPLVPIFPRLHDPARHEPARQDPPARD